MTAAPTSSASTSTLGMGEPVVRPVHGLMAVGIGFFLEHWRMFLAPLRRFLPILSVGQTTIVTRNDDVREIFATDQVFGVPYAKKLDVIMGGRSFFLGMGDTPEYRSDTAAMREVVRPDDIATRLVPAALAAAERAVEHAGGRIEAVGDLVRQVTFEVLLDYFGTPSPTVGDLKVWATRLFEFQFADASDDPALAKEVAIYAPALRAHVQSLIEARRSSGLVTDDVLGRCLAKQAEGRPEFTDDKIRCALVGFIVGGLPQPPMVGPHALEQLLRRPAILAQAQAAARTDDDALLGRYVFEAMRFDPLAPFLSRIALRDYVLADGTPRAKTIKRGANVMVSFASAMMDPRRIRDPDKFDTSRAPSDYIHFGSGLHQCFGIHINHALLPLMLKPLLRRDGLIRAPGAEGHLRKQGPFADRLVVTYR